MKSCDVLIVGGGPAGSTAAHQLQDRGLDVLVLDRARFPRDKVCAGWITPGVVSDLRLDLEHYAQQSVVQPIHQFRVRIMGGIEVETPRSPKPVSFGIRRCEFDDYLLRRSGARLQLGESLDTMRREGDGWIVNDVIRTPIVVGAGGHFCPVARLAGDETDSRAPAVLAQEIEFAMSPAQREGCRVDPAVPELFFCADLKGYGWVFRKEHHLNVGLGREDPHGLSAHVATFCDWLISQGKVPADLPRKFRGHAYLLYPCSRRRLVGDGMLLIGDAAGLAWRESGEGIGPAIESALIAADVIGNADRDYRRDNLAKYERRLTERFGSREARAGLIGRLPDRMKEVLARRLMTTNWFAHRVVVQRWFLREGRQSPAATST